MMHAKLAKGRARECLKHASQKAFFLASVLMLASAGRAWGAPRAAPRLSQQPSQAPAPKVGPTNEVKVLGCLDSQNGKLTLTDEDGNIYDLTGAPAGLGKQAGDELEISGVEGGPPKPPNEHLSPETTLKVTSVKTALRKSPAGVQPVLGELASWETYSDKTYGLSLNYPKAFKRLNQDEAPVTPNFVDPNGVVSLLSLGVPQATYPGSNFASGSVSVYVDPAIGTEGTCRQFASTSPGPASFEVNGINFAETELIEGSLAAAADGYYLNTYQHGLCYEFVFDFFGEDGTGLPLLCSLQWVSHQNQRDLMNSVLSSVSFTVPEEKNPAAGKPRESSPPSVVSFDRTMKAGRVTTVKVSWSTRGADYVQLHFPCVNLVFLGELQCGPVADRNYPPNGSEELISDNFTSSPVEIVLTLEPFYAGVGYPQESKTVSIPIAATPLPGSPRRRGP